MANFIVTYIVLFAVEKAIDFLMLYAVNTFHAYIFLYMLWISNSVWYYDLNILLCHYPLHCDAFLWYSNVIFIHCSIWSGKPFKFCRSAWHLIYQQIYSLFSRGTQNRFLIWICIIHCNQFFVVCSPFGSWKVWMLLVGLDGRMKMYNVLRYDACLVLLSLCLLIFCSSHLNVCLKV